MFLLILEEEALYNYGKIPTSFFNVHYRAYNRSHVFKLQGRANKDIAMY
jgi:hypothetical protein